MNKINLLFLAIWDIWPGIATNRRRENLILDGLIVLWTRWGRFISLRIGLCSVGDGKVTFKNFKYKPIK
jgi:hypothetical protein